MYQLGKDEFTKQIIQLPQFHYPMLGGSIPLSSLLVLIKSLQRRFPQNTPYDSMVKSAAQSNQTSDVTGGVCLIRPRPIPLTSCLIYYHPLIRQYIVRVCDSVIT